MKPGFVRLWAVGAAAVVLALLGGCASTQPIVYHRSSPDAARQARVASDVEQCRSRAVELVGVNGRTAPKRVAGEAGKVGGVLFVAKATAEAVENGSREVWTKARGAAAGGFTGMLTKTLLEWNESDEVHQGYVERCLKERGHEVLGWR